MLKKELQKQNKYLLKEDHQYLKTHVKKQTVGMDVLLYSLICAQPNTSDSPSFYIPENSAAYVNYSRQYTSSKCNNLTLTTLFFLVFISTVRGADVVFLPDSHDHAQNNHVNLDKFADAEQNDPTFARLADGPLYKGFSTKIYIKEKDIQCIEKRYGNNEAKHCKFFKDEEGHLGEDEYYMKEVAVTLLEESGKGNIMKSNPLRAMYSFAFVKRISTEIRTPNLKLFLEKSKDKSYKSKYYCGSQFMKDFVPAANIRNPLKDKMNEASLQKIMRSKIEEAIGHENFINLLVMTTFIFDLAENWNNWGHDKRGHLVLVDGDYPLLTFDDYIAGAIRSLTKLVERGFLLSVDDISEMKNKYIEMKAKKLPSIHTSVDMSRDGFECLLQIYIEACDKTIREHSKTKKPSETLASKFIKNIEIASHPFQNKSETKITEFKINL